MIEQSKRLRLQEIKEELLDLASSGDNESNHITADSLLLEALEVLADVPIVADIQSAYNKITKWYA